LIAEFMQSLKLFSSTIAINLSLSKNYLGSGYI